MKQQPMDAIGSPELSTETHSFGQWATLAILSSVAALCMGGVFVSFSVYLPAITHNEPWSGGMIGTALTLMLLGSNLSGIVAGLVADHIDPRQVLATSVLTLGLGCWIATFWHTIVSFLLGSALIGLGLGATTITSISILTAVFVHRQGLALGVYFAMIAVGASLGPVGQEFLIDRYGWRYSLQLTGIVIASTVALMYFLPRPAQHEAAVLENGTAGTPRNQGWAGIQNLGFLFLTLGMVLAACSTQGVLYSVLAYLVEFGMRSDTSVDVLSISNFLAVPAFLAAGLMADRWGPRRILNVSLIVQGIGSLILLAVFVHGPWGIISLGAFALSWGPTSGMYNQLAPMILGEIAAAEHYGMLLGVSNAVSGTVSAFTPLLTAGLLASGGYTSVFIAYGLMCLIAIPLFAMARASRA